MSVTITDPAPALIQRAAIATGMPAGTILSYSRKRRVSYIRFAIWYVMRTKHGFTYSDIAAHFNRDHSAII